MFEVKHIVTVWDDVSQKSRAFETEQEAKAWVKLAEKELAVEKFNSLVIAKLKVPFIDSYEDVNVYAVKLNDYNDYETIKAWNEAIASWGEDYTEDPMNYPCIKFLIEAEHYIEFSSYDLKTAIRDFSKVVSTLADINSKENGKA